MVGYRTHAEPSIIRRSAEVWPEGVESFMGLATNFTPPYPFPGLPSLTGGDGEGEVKAIPTASAITFVRGDAFAAQYLFVGVCWTPTEPVPAPTVAWEQRYWAAEIRDPDNHPADPCAYYNGWIPVWGGLPTNGQMQSWFEMTEIAEFTCEAIYTEAPVPGTLVTVSLTSAETIIYPGDYLWDLQSASERTEDVDTEVVTLGGVRTWLQGPVTVLADYTITPEKV